MRTTIDLADDVAAAVEKARRERGLGLSEAVDDLVRAGLVAAAPRVAGADPGHRRTVKVGPPAYTRAVMGGTSGS